MHTIVVSKWYIARAVRTDTYGLDLVAALNGPGAAALLARREFDGGGGRKEREGKSGDGDGAREDHCGLVR